MPKQSYYYRLSEADNVAIALPGASRTVPAGHKLALVAIGKGELVVKGGETIGVASADIAADDHVHSHNLQAVDGGTRARSLCPEAAPVSAEAMFWGIRRPDGRVGTRNYIAIIIVGNCAATAARTTADWFDAERLAEFPNVDGVIPFTHEIGCGMEMTGEPMDLLRRTLSGYIRNPNVYGAVVMALGCERNNLKVFLEQEKLAVGERLKTVTIQEVGGIRQAIDTARNYVLDMLPKANHVSRLPVPISELTLAFQTSAPDGFSVATVNPVMGKVADLVTAAGGTVIISEMPELIAASDSLASRISSDQHSRLRERLAWWRDYSRGRDTAFSGRLKPSVSDAGITNAVELAVDSIAKQGTGEIVEVVQYAERPARRGLVFMDGPDYDPVCVTGQIASGATLVVMGTGHGSTFGSLPAPTLKLSSTSDVLKHNLASIDVDCGTVLEGESISDTASRVIAALLATASGEKTRSEQDGLGENEFVPWSIGVLA